MTFPEAVNHWHDAFALLGTAAVALLGLLFIALSLRDDVRAQSDEHYLKRMVSQNLSSYVTVFLMSVFFLIPDASAQAISISISAVLAGPLLVALRNIPTYWRQLQHDLSLFVWYAVVQTGCYAAALVGAVLMGRYEEDALTAMFTAMVFLVIIPTMNAWHLTSSMSSD